MNTPRQSSPPALILAGGLGTRLRSIHPETPKALVPVAGRPFLAWQLDWLTRASIHRVHLAAGHLGAKITEWLENNSFPDLEITLSVEPEPLGTAGGLAFGFRRSGFDADAVLVLNGDTLLPELDPLRLTTALRAATAAVIAVTRIDDARRYGTVEIDHDNAITGFREKGRSGPGYVNGGTYLIKADAILAIPTSHPSSLETDIFPALASRRVLMSFPCPPPLLDMGTPEGLRTMSRFLDDTPPDST